MYFNGQEPVRKSVTLLNANDIYHYIKRKLELGQLHQISIENDEIEFDIEAVRAFKAIQEVVICLLDETKRMRDKLLQRRSESLGESLVLNQRESCGLDQEAFLERLRALEKASAQHIIDPVALDHWCRKFMSYEGWLKCLNAIASAKKYKFYRMNENKKRIQGQIERPVYLALQEMMKSERVDLNSVLKALLLRKGYLHQSPSGELEVQLALDALV